MAQDVVTAWQVWRRKPVNRFQWITNRVMVYGALLALLIMMQTRFLAGKTISSGQPAPGPLDIVLDLLNDVHGVSAATGWSQPLHVWLFVLGVILPVLGLFARGLYRRRLPRGTGTLLLWIGLSYAALTFMAIVSNGPIKYVHITHVGIALAILMAGLLTMAPRRLAAGVLLVYAVSAALILSNSFAHPFSLFSDAAAALERLQSSGERVFLGDDTVSWAFQVNIPQRDVAEMFPDDVDAPPRTYWYLGYHDWHPVPPECDPAPVWEEGPIHIHHCVRAAPG